MRNLLSVVFVFLVVSGTVFASNDVGGDQYEVRLVSKSSVVNEDNEAMLRLSSEWMNWEADHVGWMALMDEKTVLPHRAWGP
jgi:hypothetical protein